MIESRQRVKNLCDKLMQIAPSQIVTDLVQDDIEEAVHSDEVTPDEIGSLCYQCSILLDIYDPQFSDDISYLTDIKNALDDWGKDAEFANRALGLDPNN